MIIRLVDNTRTKREEKWEKLKVSGHLEMSGGTSVVGKAWFRAFISNQNNANLSLSDAIARMPVETCINPRQSRSISIIANAFSP